MGEKEVKKIEVELQETIRPNGRMGVVVKSDCLDLINRLKYEASLTSEYNYDEIGNNKTLIYSDWADCKIEDTESLLERAVKVIKNLKKKTVTIFL